MRYFQRLTLRIPDGRLFAALESHFRFLLTAVSAATLSVWVANLFFPAQPARLGAPFACVIVAPLLLTTFAALNFLSLCRDLAEHLSDQAVTDAKLWPKE